MSAIIEFLLARIAEDERHARKLAEADGRPALSLATKASCPQRLLAECDAKRAIVAAHAHYAAMEDHERGSDFKLVSKGMEQGLAMALEALADRYSDHPDYQPVWTH